MPLAPRFRWSRPRVDPRCQSRHYPASDHLRLGPRSLESGRHLRRRQSRRLAVRRCPPLRDRTWPILRWPTLPKSLGRVRRRSYRRQPGRTPRAEAPSPTQADWHADAGIARSGGRGRRGHRRSTGAWISRLYAQRLDESLPTRLSARASGSLRTCSPCDSRAPRRLSNQIDKEPECSPVAAPRRPRAVVSRDGPRFA